MPSTPPPIHELLLASGIEFIEQSVANFWNGSYELFVIHSVADWEKCKRGVLV